MRMGQPSHLHRPATPAAASSVQRARSFAAELIRQFPVGLYSTAQSLAAAVGFFALMGGLYFATDSWAFEPFDLNGDLVHGFYAPPIFSAGLLFAASWFAFSQRHVRATPGWAWLGIAVLFAFMAVDELVSFHEQLTEWTGTDWQLLYLPLVAAAAVMWLVILGSMRAAVPAPMMWVGGVVAWFGAQGIEHFQYDANGDPVAAAPYLILVEEPAEMLGSALFLIAILIFARRAAVQDQRP